MPTGRTPPEPASTLSIAGAVPVVHRGRRRAGVAVVGPRSGRKGASSSAWTTSTARRCATGTHRMQETTWPAAPPMRSTPGDEPGIERSAAALSRCIRCRRAAGAGRSRGILGPLWRRTSRTPGPVMKDAGRACGDALPAWPQVRTLRVQGRLAPAHRGPGNPEPAAPRILLPTPAVQPSRSLTIGPVGPAERVRGPSPRRQGTAAPRT